MGSVNVSYQDNALHQYTLVGAVTPTYDNNGNVTSFDGAMTMGYDCENRLQTAGAVSYGYDLLGRRISRAVSTGNTMYVYDGPHIIAEYLNGSLIRKYIYGPGIDNPVAMVRCLSSMEVWYYYYKDVLGSVRLLTNASGAVVESYTGACPERSRGNPYGQPRVMFAAGLDVNWLTEDVATYSSSPVVRGNVIMFTGRWWDSAAKLYYYRFRDYSPTLGRFLQPDPAKYIDGMNLYAYCGNNPINRIDPFGLMVYDPNLPFDPGGAIEVHWDNSTSEGIAVGAGAGFAFVGGLAIASAVCPEAVIGGLIAVGAGAGFALGGALWGPDPVLVYPGDSGYRGGSNSSGASVPTPTTPSAPAPTIPSAPPTSLPDNDVGNGKKQQDS